MSKNSQTTDPYLYPNSSVLINKFGLKNQEALQEMEGFIYGLKNFGPLPDGNFDYDHLKAIHHHFFGDIYEWAGQERTVDIAKGDCYFGHKQYITKELNKLFSKLKTDNYLRDISSDEFCKKLSFYFNEINAAHPFREGNGRTQRAFCDAIAKKAGYSLDWTKADRDEYIQASIDGFLHGKYEAMESVFKKITSTLSQDLKIDEIAIEKNIIDVLKNYVTKQLELTESIRQKHQLLAEKPERSNTISQKVLMLNSELRQIAKTLMNEPFSKEFLNQPYPLSLQKQGGFEAINERFKNNVISKSDIVCVLRHAKNSISTSQALNQKNNRTQ